MDDAKTDARELADRDRLLAAAEARLAEAEARLLAAAAREQQLDAVLANAPVVVFALDADGVFTLSEGRGLAGAGLKPGEVVGTKALPAYGAVEFIDPLGGVTNGRVVLEGVLAGRPYAGLSHLGNSVYDNRIIPVRDAAGAVTGAIGISTDVTEGHRAQIERRKLEEQLRQTQKMEAIGRLAGGVAHDFNNLLTAIMGGIQFAHDALPEGDPLRIELRDSLDAAWRAAALTRQLLAFSRKQPLQPRLTDLNLLVRDLTSMLRRLLGETVALQIDLEPTPLWVRIDPGQMEQVVVNLVINARDAMAGSGRLRIEARRVLLDGAPAGAQPQAPAGPFALLAVTDDGAGMDDSVLQRIFEPFFTTKEAGRGTGLGLATVHGVVQQSGGHVTVESEPGRGSTFRVFLPERDPPADEGETKAPAPDHRPPTGNGTILVAEDEPAVRVFVARVLTRAGYRVLEAESGAHALALARAHPGTIDLLVSDVVMPGISGPELASQLRALRGDVRVLLLSGYLDDRLGERARVSGDVELLLKPLSAEALLARVQQSLAAPSASF